MHTTVSWRCAKISPRDDIYYQKGSLLFLFHCGPGDVWRLVAPRTSLPSCDPLGKYEIRLEGPRPVVVSVPSLPVSNKCNVINSWKPFLTMALNSNTLEWLGRFNKYSFCLLPWWLKRWRFVQVVLWFVEWQRCGAVLSLERFFYFVFFCVWWVRWCSYYIYHIIAPKKIMDN